MRAIVLASLWIVGAAGVATADIDQQKGDELFAEAVALRDTDPALACSKFEEALGYNPQAPGVLLNVAMCDEQRGRIASAVARLQDLADRAREQGLAEYERSAVTRLEALRPLLPHLSIQLASPVAPETKVLVDDRVVPTEQLAKLPVDPGERVVVVTAPGRVAFRTTIRAVQRETVDVAVPVLASSVIKSSRRTIGKITVAAGGASLLTAGVLALVAHGDYNELFDTGQCERGTRICTDQGHARAQSARTLGGVATAAAVVGGAAIGVGAWLWLRAPSPTAERQVVVLPHADPDGTVGVTAVGRF